jgi:hypothetical protein
MAETIVRELAPLHPQPGNTARAVPVVQAILERAADPVAEAARIRTSHAGWREFYLLRGPGHFIPMLPRWFSEGNWEYIPTGAIELLKRPPARESKYETAGDRVDRVVREMMNAAAA